MSAGRVVPLILVLGLAIGNDVRPAERAAHAPPAREDAADPASPSSLLGTLSRASISSAGAQGNDESGLPDLSRTGRFVAFESRASNLVPNDFQLCFGLNCPDVFVHDQVTGSTRMMSVSTSSTRGDDASGAPAISATGRFVAFESLAENLVAGDDDGDFDVYLRDRDTDRDGIFDEPGAVATKRMSATAAGGAPNGASLSPAISSSGRYVAFASIASNLVTGDTRFKNDIFVRDRDADGDGVFDELGQVTVTRASVSSTGTEANQNSDFPDLSLSGRFVAFESLASNLVPRDTRRCAGLSCSDVFVHDLQTGKTKRVSVATSGAEANNESHEAAISGNGRFVAFSSYATNLVPGDRNGKTDVFVRDRDVDGDGVYDEPGAVTTLRVSLSTEGAEANGDSREPAIDGDGRFVAFTSSARNLVPGHDPNGVSDLFVRDRDTDQDGIFDEPRAVRTFRASSTPAGKPGDNISREAALSDDGGVLAFSSASTDLLVPDENGSVFDIYVEDPVAP